MRDSQQEQTADIRESEVPADVADDAGLIRGDSGEGGFSAKKTPKDRWSFVYFIQFKDETGPIKIGHTKHPDARLSNLQMASPYLLRMLGYAPVDDGSVVEERLHYRFEACLMRGEWFACIPEILDLAARADRYRWEQRWAILAGDPEPPPPREFTWGSRNEQIDPDLTTDVIRELHAIRSADRQRGLRNVPQPKSKPAGRSLKPGEFMWRGKIRKP